MPVFYRIDRNDRIAQVNSDWDDFALANGGGVRATKASVVGQPLIDFIAGDSARMFVRAALDAARNLQATRVLPYRCDSPTERRRFEMVISPEPDGGVLVEHRLVSSEARAERLSRPPGAIRGRRCSQCLSVRLAGATRWMSIDEAPEGLLATDVCPACATRLFGPADPTPEHKHVD